MIGSLSESGGKSTETLDTGLNTGAGLGVASRPLDFASGEVFLLTSGLREAVVFFAGAGAVLETARVVRAGAGGSATWVVVFVRVEERVALGLLAIPARAGVRVAEPRNAK